LLLLSSATTAAAVARLALISGLLLLFEFALLASREFFELALRFIVRLRPLLLLLPLERFILVLHLVELQLE
jgi:hypothetical protein